MLSWRYAAHPRHFDQMTESLTCTCSEHSCDDPLDRQRVCTTMTYAVPGPGGLKPLPSTVGILTTPGNDLPRYPMGRRRAEVADAIAAYHCVTKTLHLRYDTDSPGP